MGPLLTPAHALSCLMAYACQKRRLAPPLRRYWFIIDAAGPDIN